MVLSFDKKKDVLIKFSEPSDMQRYKHLLDFVFDLPFHYKPLLIGFHDFFKQVA